MRRRCGRASWVNCATIAASWSERSRRPFSSSGGARADVRECYNRSSAMSLKVPGFRGHQRGIAMKGVIDVDDTNFENEVLRSPLPVLLDFSAEWCAPCKKLAPIVEAVAGEYPRRPKIAHLDIDKAQATAVKYGIMSVPTVLFFKGGKVLDQLLGYVPREKLVEKIDRIL